MKERPKKWTRRRLLIAAVVVPLFYVLSSGPMASLAFSRDVWIHPIGDNADVAEVITHRGMWWPKIYAPLLWMTDYSWGTAIRSYWNLFPVSISNADE
jgi:hypothetical protein